MGTSFSAAATRISRWCGVSAVRIPSRIASSCSVCSRPCEAEPAEPKRSQASGSSVSSRSCQARRRGLHGRFEDRELRRPGREPARAPVGRELAQDGHERVVGGLHREIVDLPARHRRQRATAAPELEAGHTQEVGMQAGHRAVALPRRPAELVDPRARVGVERRAGGDDGLPNGLHAAHRSLRPGGQQGRGAP